jgi:agarase
MAGQVARTRWGGVADGRFRPGGRFHVAQDNDVFWLVDPDGGRFLSKGVNTVRIDQDRVRDSDRVPYAEACLRKYASEAVWRTAAAARLASWGFNTLGSWSDDAVGGAGPVPLAVTPNLDLGMSFAWETNEAAKDAPPQDFPDVFDPAFDRHVRRRAQAQCAPRGSDAAVIGWFIDNELRWGPDWRGPDELLTLFLNLSPATPGRTAAVDFLRGRYRDFIAFNTVWRAQVRAWDELKAFGRLMPPFSRKPPYARDAPSEAEADRNPLRAAFAADCDDFLTLVAERYFAATAAAIRAADARHLVLGCRFAYPPPPAIVDAAARHVDVMSFNCYDVTADAAIATYAARGKPCLIGEFSFRGADSGLPNTNGAGPVVANQAERAAAFRNYVTAALRHPHVVGYHWFEHADQPAEGRFDGENSNFGTVTINDRVYDALTRTMTAVNAEAETVHAASAARIAVQGT